MIDFYYSANFITKIICEIETFACLTDGHYVEFIRESENNEVPNSFLYSVIIHLLIV